MKLIIKTYSIDYHPESAATDSYYEVKINGDFTASFEGREKAQKYVDDLKQTVIIRTRKVGQYFRGVIRNGYFPIDGKKLWYVACDSYSGGNEIPLLKIIDYKCETEKQLIDKLTTFKRKYKLISDKQI